MKLPSNCLYPFFWQHGEAPEVLSDYVDKIAQSGMGGFCIEARPHPDFLGAGWWHDLDLILGKAREKDMKVWILDDSHFPTGFANGKIRDCYPQYKKLYLDVRRYDVQGPMRGARVDLRLLKGRPWEKPDDSVHVLGVFLAKRTSQKTEEGDPILPETLTEITDQMDVVTRLYEQNFTQVLADWCNAHDVWYLGHTIEDNGSHSRLGYGTGHYFRGQAGMDLAGVDVIGGQVMPGMNYHHDAFNMGGSNGEFYPYALAKLASSAARLDPKKQGRAMCEAFGAYGWSEGLKTMKWIADHLMVRGINYMVPHAFNPKEYADFDSPPHFYAHGHNLQFRYFHILSDYINRTMEQFRDGIHPAKVGLFYPAEQEWAGEAMLVEKPARELTTHQITFDIVTRDYLQRAEISSGGYTINGQRLEVLVIPWGEAFPADSAHKLLELAAVGAKVYFIQDYPEGIVGGSENGLLCALRSACGIVKLTDLGTALSAYQAAALKAPEPDLVVEEYEAADDVSATSSGDGGAEEKKGGNPVMKLANGIILPCMPALVGCGLVSALATILQVLGLTTNDAGIGMILYGVGQTCMYFMPIIIGGSAAQFFGISPYLGNAVGGALMYSTFIEAANAGTTIQLFGVIPVAVSNYSGTLLPAIVSVWAAAGCCSSSPWACTWPLSPSLSTTCLPSAMSRSWVCWRAL